MSIKRSVEKLADGSFCITVENQADNGVLSIVKQSCTKVMVIEQKLGLLKQLEELNKQAEKIKVEIVALEDIEQQMK